MAYQEQTKDFTNEHGQFGGDKNKLLIKNAMCDKEDKKIIGTMYSLEKALSYLDTHYNSDGNLNNSSFSYLYRIPTPRNGKEMYSNCLEIFHIMKVIISLGLEGRITRMTLDLIISKRFTTEANSQ